MIGFASVLKCWTPLSAKNEFMECDGTENFWSRAIVDRREALSMLSDGATQQRIEELVTLVAGTLFERRQVLLFGNGGSAASAEHAAAEWVGRFCMERDALPAVALTANSAIVSAISNDYGFEHLFARQIEALGRPGDMAIGLSTSGASANVARGLRTAAHRGLRAVALVGPTLGAVGHAADLVIRVPTSTVPVIQEMHHCVLHVVADEVDRRLAHEPPGPQAAGSRRS